MTTGPDRFDVTPSVANHFAWLRTRLSLESTFMAWQRTSVSLIGFGFTIVQFFQRLRGMETSTGRQMREEMPRNLGLALIGTGICIVIIASWQYRQQLRYLWSPQFAAIAGMGEKPRKTPSMIAAAVLTVIGLAAFLSVFFRFL